MSNQVDNPTTISLYQTGAIPGIPGVYSPGDYTVDYDARTATLIQDENSQVVSAEQVAPPPPDNTTDTTQPSA